MANPSHSFILMVGDDSVLLLPPQHLPDADPLFADSHDPEDIEALTEAITMAPHLPVIILSDCSDQHYSYETIPPLSSTDRKKFLERRVKDVYPDAAYRAALPQGSTKALMVGVNETNTLALWQERISKLPNPVGVLALLPLESANMMAALWPGSKEGWSLFLSFHKTGGTRQIVTYNGDLVFTRLTAPLSENTSVGYMSATIAVDIKATRDYLLRMGFSNEMPFHLVALMPPAMLSAMKATPLDVSSRHFFTPYEAAVRLGLPLAPEKNETISDLIHTLWLAQRSEPKVLLAKASTLQEFRQIKIHKFGMTAAILSALIAGVYLGQETLGFLKSQRIIYEIQYDIDQLNKTYTKQQEKITSAAEPLSRLRMAVERKRLFKKDKPEVIRILTAIKDTLGENTRLHDLSWDHGTLTLTLRLTDETLLKKPITLNKAEIKNQFKLVEQNMQTALQGMDPVRSVQITKLPFTTSENEPLSTPQEEEKQPLATYTIQRRKG